MKHARGEYIMFCDSDDSYRSYTIELMYETIIANSSDIVVSQFEGYHYQSIQEYLENPPTQIMPKPTDVHIKEILEGEQTLRFGFSMPISIVSSDIIKKISNDWHEDLFMITGEDYLHGLMLSYYAQKVVYISGITYNYTRHGSNSSGQWDKSISKYLSDMQILFEYSREFLFKYDIFEKYREDFENLYSRISRRVGNLDEFRLWVASCDNVEYIKTLLCGSQYLLKLTKEVFSKEQLGIEEIEKIELITAHPYSNPWAQFVRSGRKGKIIWLMKWTAKKILPVSVVDLLKKFRKH